MFLSMNSEMSLLAPARPSGAKRGFSFLLPFCRFWQKIHFFQSLIVFDIVAYHYKGICNLIIGAIGSKIKLMYEYAETL